MTYYTADSYKNWERASEPFDRNGRKYTIVKHACSRCNGTGVYGWGAVINGITQYAGSCFKCGGTGVEQKTVRLYTESEHASLQKAAENRRNKAEELKERRLKARQNDWPRNNGFNDEKETWIFLKGNTYAIKEELKKEGYKFNKELGWHGDHKIEDLSEGYETVKISLADVYEFTATDEREPEFIGAEYIVSLKAGLGNGNFVGRIGERLRALNVQLVSVREYSGTYGLSYIYQFSYNGETLVWMTSKELGLEINEWCELTGTVKRHETYNGVNQTYLNRCTVK